MNDCLNCRYPHSSASSRPTSSSRERANVLNVLQSRTHRRPVPRTVHTMGPMARYAYSSAVPANSLNYCTDFNQILLNDKHRHPTADCAKSVN